VDVSSKFDKLAAQVGSERLAGWITRHSPKVRARADATRAKSKAKRRTARQMMQAGKA
jgi:hypothetical protein